MQRRGPLRSWGPGPCITAAVVTAESVTFLHEAYATPCRKTSTWQVLCKLLPTGTVPFTILSGLPWMKLWDHTDRRHPVLPGANIPRRPTVSQPLHSPLLTDYRNYPEAEGEVREGVTARQGRYQGCLQQPSVQFTCIL